MLDILPFKYYSYDMSLSWNTNSENKQSYSNIAGMTHLLPAAVQIKWGMKEGKVCDWDCHLSESGNFRNSAHLLK